VYFYQKASGSCGSHIGQWRWRRSQSRCLSEHPVETNESEDPRHLVRGIDEGELVARPVRVAPKRNQGGQPRSINPRNPAQIEAH